MKKLKEYQDYEEKVMKQCNEMTKELEKRTMEKEKEDTFVTLLADKIQEIEKS